MGFLIRKRLSVARTELKPALALGIEPRSFGPQTTFNDAAGRGRHSNLFNWFFLISSTYFIQSRNQFFF